MVEPVSTALAGIALVKASVSFIKDNIKTCKDIGDIMSHVDNMFQGEKQINQKRFKDDKFGVKSVAQEVIDSKLAQEQMYEISQLIDHRFGHGTWQFILTERKRRIEEAKEKERKRLVKKRQEKEEMMQTVRMVGIAIGAVLVGVIIIIFVAIALATEVNSKEHIDCGDFYKGFFICMNEDYDTARAQIYKGNLQRKQKITNCRLVKQEQLYDKLRQQRIRPGGFRCYYECPGMEDLCVSSTGERFMCRRNMDCKY
jgi:tetrahydromethanopterin S-methyltransferase subunit F